MCCVHWRRCPWFRRIVCGTRRGRTPTINQDAIRQRLAMGQSPTRIAREMGISRGTVYTAKKAATPPDTTS